METLQQAVPSTDQQTSLPEHVLELKAQLLKATTDAAGPIAVQQAMPLSAVKQVLQCAAALCKGEPTCLEISVQEPCEVVVVGDTHGQFHDVCAMLDKFGYPSAHRMYIFNGDYVDRGSWGYELMLLLLTLKLEYPTRCFLLRGNHESTTCTTWYGFKAELAAKWGMDGNAVYAAFKKLFSVLPLAAVVNQTTLILHGGLFRSAPAPKFGKASMKSRKRKAVVPSGVPGAEPLLELGTLQELRVASKGGTDPDGQGNNVVASDVLWSDPGPEPGLKLNDVRGVGLVFGPDITQEFLTQNNLKLVIRSHEGPDARDRRGDLPQVMTGWSLDHDTPAGQLLTLFSAPDYPQFMAPEERRYNNQGAVAILSAPTWSQPQLLSFDAVQPRPPPSVETPSCSIVKSGLSVSSVASGSASQKFRFDSPGLSNAGSEQKPMAVAYYDYLVYADTDEDPVGSSCAGSEAGSEMEGDAVRGERGGYVDMDGEGEEAGSGRVAAEQGAHPPAVAGQVQPSAWLPAEAIGLAQAHVQKVLAAAAAAAQQQQHRMTVSSSESASHMVCQGASHGHHTPMDVAPDSPIQPAATHKPAGCIGVPLIKGNNSPSPSPSKTGAGTARAVRDHAVLAAMRGTASAGTPSPGGLATAAEFSPSKQTRANKRKMEQEAQGLSASNVDQPASNPSNLSNPSSTLLAGISQLASPAAAAERGGSTSASKPDAHSLRVAVA